MRIAGLIAVAVVSLPYHAWADVVPAPGPEERVERSVAIASAAKCDEAAWRRAGRLGTLLRPGKVVRGPNLIVDFKLESVAPHASHQGLGGVVGAGDRTLANAFFRCSYQLDGQSVPPGTRVHDPVSGLDVEVTSVQPADRSGREWVGVRCGLRIADPAQPSRYLEVPVAEVPASNQLTGIMRDGDSVFLLLQFNGYARAVNGHGNLIVAGDLCSHRSVWRSPDMVSNSPLLLMGEYLITGYGFTAEPHWLFVFDRRTGRQIKKLPLPKMAEDLRVSGDKLYVRLYDGYAIFSLARPAAGKSEK